MIDVTIEKIRAACVECGDCWEWTGIVSVSGVPKINVSVGRGKSGRTVLSARRVVWELVKKPLHPKQWVTTSCGNPRCLNPKHLALTNASEVAEKNGARPSVKLKRAASAPKHQAKLTQEKVDEARASNLSTDALMQKYGVSRSTIRRAIRGDTWRDYSSPFAGLMA